MPKTVAFNKGFFKKWSPGMAYVLGYFTADGCMFINPRGSKYILFVSVEPEILNKVRKLLDSKHKIGIQKSKNPKWKNKCSLQIGSKEMFQDLLNLGLTPNKSKTIKLPKIPKKYFRHFIRGYFDGDGCVFFKRYKRTNRKGYYYALYVILTSGNKKFLENTLKLIRKYARVNKGKIYKKNKNSGFELRFADKESILKLYEFIYKDISSDQFLKRKCLTFQKILNYWGRSSVG